MKTMSAKAAELQERWYLVDAKDQVLGRLASRIANVLRGKHLPNYTPHLDMKTHVVVVNAAQVKLTGNKWRDKTYYRHTGWPGGIRSATAEELQTKKPGQILRFAVQGMLAKNRLGRATMKRLRIFAGPEHQHKAQKPEPIDLHTRQAREDT